MKAALLALILLAGCAATGTAPAVAPGAQPVGAASAAADFAAARPGLRRIGYRNCDGYAVELFAPARVGRATIEGQSLFLRAYAYRAGGAIRTRLPGAAARVQQRSGSGWRDLPLTVSGSGSIGGAFTSVPLVAQLGQGASLPPGRYRLWLGQFSASRDGASCAISPVWQFDIV